MSDSHFHDDHCYSVGAGDTEALICRWRAEGGMFGRSEAADELQALLSSERGSDEASAWVQPPDAPQADGYAPPDLHLPDPTTGVGEVAALLAPQGAKVTTDDVGDVVCPHGTAMDVHCCNCHSGFVFDMAHECPPTLADAAEMLWVVLANVSGGSSRDFLVPGRVECHPEDRASQKAIYATWIV